MIFKKMKAKGKSKPMAWQINDLIDYIRSQRKQEDLKKISFAGSRGFLAGTHSGQIGEMIAVASEATHTNNPVSHYMLSWREGEIPSGKQVDECVDIFLEQMGLVGHQCIYALHGDTKCCHLHIAVNRYNEELAKVVRPNGGFDIKQGHKAIAVIESRQGWSSENNAVYAVEGEELVKVQSVRKIQPSQPAQDFEQKTGTMSAERIAQEKAIIALKGASSWKDLHQRMAEVGLRYEKKGSGAIIKVGDIAVKASNVHRSLSMAKLKKGWGEFVPSEDQTELKPLPPQPVSKVNQALWQEYQTEMAQVDTKATNEQARKKFEEGKKELAEQTQKKYESCDRIGRKHGPELRRIARIGVQEEKRAKRTALWRTYQKEKRSPLVKVTFSTWLKRKGLTRQADLWRHRATIEAQIKPPVPEPKLLPSQPSPQLEMFRRYAEALQADRFRVTSIKMNKADGQKRAFIVDKKGGVSNGFSPEEMTAKMDYLIALDKRGENIYYTPMSGTMHHILVDDMTPEKYQEFLEDGFKPAITLESSPNNYQCILTIPKHGSHFDKEIANRISKELNQKYGDPKLSGAVHPHRAPGFGNQKPKHQKEDGSFPKVKLIAANKCQCKRLQRIADRARQNLEQEALARKRKQRERCLASRVQPGNATNAYYAHLDNIKDHFSGENMDLSRVDAMIALRMRATGHSEESIRQTIMDCAPTIREGAATRRNWNDYARRTANYAFGAAGDIALNKYSRMRKIWSDIENNAEPLPAPKPIQMPVPVQNPKLPSQPVPKPEPIQEQQKKGEEQIPNAPAYRLRMR